MNRKSRISGIFQIVLGVTILAAGAIIFYQKIRHGGADKLNLKYIDRSFQILRETHMVHNEQEKKLEKLLRLQLLHASVSTENWLKFKECAESISAQCRLYAADQRAAAESCAGELRRLEAYRKICADARHFPLYVSALENTAGAVTPLKEGLAAAADLQNFTGFGESFVRRIGSSFHNIHAPLETLDNALGNARSSLASISRISREELVPALDGRIAALKEQIRTSKQHALAAEQHGASVNRLCAMADLQNNIGNLNAAVKELNIHIRNRAEKKLAAENDMNYTELSKTVSRLKQEIAETEKSKAELHKKSPGKDLRDYDRLLNDLRDKLSSAQKRMETKEFLYDTKHVISESSQRLEEIEGMKKSMTVIMVCELIFCLSTGTGFIVNGARLCHNC